MTNTQEITFPKSPPSGDEITTIRSEDMMIYSRFMNHLFFVPTSRMDIRILSSIQFTGDILGYSDAHISKVLVDLGLRASRAAFPATFLEYADGALIRTVWDVGAPSSALKELDKYWVGRREERFTSLCAETRWLDERNVYQSL